ncbi:MAG: GNAT family N-acetyltransferase [Candidatus Eremiobacteraeota bacterium]|nr:GNAT family N-acetyltransferase [Candidatus Eremiobacteraeota bacterium]
MKAALDIRRTVFVDEQGVPLEEEIDEHDLSDADAVHALAYQDDAPRGTGRFYESEPGCAQIGRMAVLPAHRDAGVGRTVLDALVGEALRRGYVRARLIAQIRAIPFYERVGFRVYGEPILDGGILHQPMEVLWKTIANPAGNRTAGVDGHGAP